jgi:hypothetical protein
MEFNCIDTRLSTFISFQLMPGKSGYSEQDASIPDVSMFFLCWRSLFRLCQQLQYDDIKADARKRARALCSLPFKFFDFFSSGVCI